MIRANSPIFTGQGKAINEAAGPNVRILTVANPCNTNCLIARSHAPKVPADRWFAMTRLDQNRAASQLAKKAGVPVGAITYMTIWGNHSDTQYPDYKNARINGKPATEVIADSAWFTETFIPTVAKRGSAVIKARGGSSAASAANAAIDSVRSIHRPTPQGDWFSAAVVSDGSYGIPAGLIYSFPLVSKGNAAWSIVAGVPIDAEARVRLDASAAELVSERDAVKELLGPAALVRHGVNSLHDVDSAQGPGGWSEAGPGVGVQADDPAAWPAAIDHDRAHVGRFGDTVMAKGVNGFDLEMKPWGYTRRDGPDELTHVLLAVGEGLPAGAGLVGPPEE